MSMLYLAQPEQQQQLEWLDGGTRAMLLDGAATNGQLMMGRFAVGEGEAPPYHKHLHEDEIFMLIKGPPWSGTTTRSTSSPKAASLPAQASTTQLPHHLEAGRPADDQHAGRHRGHVPRHGAGQVDAAPARHRGEARPGSG